MEKTIQVALDFVDLPRALKVAREAVAAGVTRIEAGTPLIKAAGLEAVRRLKKEFPRAVLVADMKTMDAGRTEAEIAFKAGARIVTVMGNSSDRTIREAVEAAQNYGGEIMVDLLEAAATVQRAREVEQLGADCVSVHIPIDRQMAGSISFRFLADVVRAVGIPVAIAGGLNSENIVAAVKAGASIFIVGGSVTKAADVKQALGVLYRALRSGKPVKTQLYRRVSAGRVREILTKVSTANISDAMHRQGWVEGLLPVVAGAVMAGPAVTVRTAPGDWAKPVEAIETARAGDVIVIDAGGVGPAVWGELATESCRSRKLAGVVINGAIRDVGEIRQMKFPAFARLIAPQAGEPKGFGEINVPVTFGGRTIHPGDWVAGDADGVVAIPRDRVAEIANRAMDVLEKENRIRSEIKQGGTFSEITNLLQWEKQR